MATDRSSNGYLAGQLLIAMPQMMDPRFQRTVIYMCAHSADGAMGLVINKPMESLSFPDLLQQLEIEPQGMGAPMPIYFGGPVETGRGFVLHSADYVEDATLVIGGNVALTANIDIVRAIASGKGPNRKLLALGYAGWGPGQLDQEIQANGWLSVPSDDNIVFGADNPAKWSAALGKLGVDIEKLSGFAGRA
jgi:putative transcriptional regulator